ncbi:MAG: hypothetical protein WBC73_19115 [Phormidesmis sp.]
MDKPRLPIPQHQRYKIGRQFLVALLLIGLFGCNSKVSQCNQFASIINQSQSFKDDFEGEIEGAMTQASGAQGLEDLRAAAEEYTGAVEKITGKIDGMTQDLEGLSIGDEQLDEYRDRYITIVTDSQAALSSASNAMQLVAEAQSEDEFRKIFDSFQTQANSAFSDLQSLSVEESTLIEQVNAYCGAEAE